MTLVFWFVIGYLIASQTGSRKARREPKPVVRKRPFLDKRPIGRRERWAWLATFTGCAALVWFVLT